MPELGGALVITQPCPSTNSWGHRGPERSESCGAHTTFSGKARMPSNNQPGTDAGRRARPGRGHNLLPAPCPAPSRWRRMLQPDSHGEGWGSSPLQNDSRKHLQARPPGLNLTPAVPTPPSGLGGQSQTQHISLHERSED